MMDRRLDWSRSAGPKGPEVGIAAKVGFLRQPTAYLEPGGRVETVETHMSWVFLTERFAYKLKKPVRYDFLDFRSLQSRRQSCEEEVRLNRRLAPEVYLGVVPLTQDPDGGLRLGGFGEPVDWLVKMHRLPPKRMLDRAIAQGTLTPPQVRDLALFLAEFYRNAPPVAMTAQAYRARLDAEIAANLRHLRDPAYDLPGHLVERPCRAQADFLAAHPALFDRRASDRRIIEAHGDLRPEHICLGPRPQIIDCLEFKREFRILDPADELSFLSLECARLGAANVEPLLFEVYREVTEDALAAELIAFYKGYRACLRAKIAIWHLREPKARTPEKWPALARTYLSLATAEATRLA
jgi:aminoglycoside phosphotransferase family enzyme